MGELYTKVRAASLAAKSGHLSGTVTQDGEKTTLDVAGLADGSNQKLVVGVGEGKGKAEILTVGGKYYMSGDKRFWKEQTGDAKAADLLVDKYVLVSAADAKELGDLSLGALLKEMFEQSELSTLEKLTSTGRDPHRGRRHGVGGERRLRERDLGRPEDRAAREDRRERRRRR